MFKETQLVSPVAKMLLSLLELRTKVILQQHKSSMDSINKHNIQNIFTFFCKLWLKVHRYNWFSQLLNDIIQITLCIISTILLLLKSILTTLSSTQVLYFSVTSPSAALLSQTVFALKNTLKLLSQMVFLITTSGNFTSDIILLNPSWRHLPSLMPFFATFSSTVFCDEAFFSYSVLFFSVTFLNLLPSPSTRYNFSHNEAILLS